MTTSQRSLDLWKKKLGPFLERHPYSSLAQSPDPSARFAIVDPWGDKAIAIELSRSEKKIIAALNSVVLPERFTALYHPERLELEIVFTAYPVREGLQDRQFKFFHKQREHACRFARSSDELLVIAENFIPVGPPGETNFRNLGSFRNYAFNKKNRAGLPPNHFGDPTSFWISNVVWNDDEVLDLVNHLNFFMTYYDSKSPRILVHTPEPEVDFSPQTRFVFDRFPSSIKSRRLDDALLTFWYASNEGDPARRFLYSYQILEYSAYYFLDDAIRQRVQKELVAPHALDNVAQVTESIIDLISEFKMHEVQKMQALLKGAVDHKLLWREVQKNISAFSKPQKFDGGFEIPEFAKESWKESDFKVHGMTAFATTIRSIRNGLSHAKEERMASVIAPTRENFEKLRLWVPLISIAASEVMVYRGL